MISDFLTDDLRRPPWKGHENPLRGHCYVASEALYHILGGKSSGLTPCSLKVGQETHWFLRDSEGTILDPTAGQFEEPPDYNLGRGRGFLTRSPSKRAEILIYRVKEFFIAYGENHG